MDKIISCVTAEESKKLLGDTPSLQPRVHVAIAPRKVVRVSVDRGENLYDPNWTEVVDPYTKIFLQQNAEQQFSNGTVGAGILRSETDWQGFRSLLPKRIPSKDHFPVSMSRDVSKSKETGMKLETDRIGPCPYLL